MFLTDDFDAPTRDVIHVQLAAVHAWPALDPRSRATSFSNLAGDVAAIREIGDRLDGKAVQGVGLDVAVEITEIVRVIVDPERRPLLDAKPVDAE